MHALRHLIPALTILCSALAPAGAQTVSATFSTAVAVSPPPAGWAFHWNAPDGWVAGGNPGDLDSGSVFEPASYRPMQWTGTMWTADGNGDGGDSSPDAYVRFSTTGGHPGDGGADLSLDRYAIAGFTIPTGGNYELANTSLAVENANSNGVKLFVLGSDGGQLDELLVGGDASDSFDQFLGYLPAGETIHVAVGANGWAGYDTFDLDFTIRTATFGGPVSTSYSLAGGSGALPAGWAIQWNAPDGWVAGSNPGDLATGSVFDPSSYRAMVWTGSMWTADGDGNSGNSSPDGAIRLNGSGGHPGAEGTDESLDRYAIAGFTIPESNLYRLSGSSLSVGSDGSGGVRLLILESDGTPIHELIVDGGAQAGFDRYLGLLPAGETLHVAIGCNSHPGSDTFDLAYTIESLSLGTLGIAQRLPADDATDVDPDADLLVTFSEPIARGAGRIMIRNISTGQTRTIDANDPNQVSVAGNVLTIRPITGIDHDMQYAIRIEPGAVEDLAGNAFSGITNDTDWSFATAAYDDSVADSEIDFSYIQGHGGWQHGYFHTDAQETFIPLDRFESGWWRPSGATQPALSRTDLVAEPDRMAARRWTPESAGSVRLVGSIQKVSADVAGELRVRVDGTELWSRRLETIDMIPHAFDILALDLSTDSRVDFVVSTQSPTQALQVRLDIRILPEPYVSSWSAALPDGYPDWTETHKQSLRDAGQSILQQIQAASDAAQRRFVIPPGDYLFHANWSQASTLEGLADLEIVADGVTFWFEPPMIHALQFKDCRNVSLRGMTIDFTLPIWFQAQVSDIDRPGETIRATLMPGYEPIDSNGLAEPAGNRAMMFYDAQGRFINTTHTPADWQLDGPDGVLIQNFTRTGIPDALEVGDYVVGTIRTGAALRTTNCDSMRFVDINVWSAPGVGVNSQLGEGGHVYRRLRATRRPFTNRLHAYGADVYHLASADYGPVMDRCEGAYSADDTLNIHGEFGWVVEQIDTRTFYFDGTYEPGDALEFWNKDTGARIGAAGVVAAIEAYDGPVIPINAGYDATGDYIVTVDQTLSLPPLTIVLMDGRETCHQWRVRDCWFHDDFQRALIDGSPDGVFENSTIQNCGHGLIVSHAIAEPWIEGPFPSNLVIRNNRFFDAPPGTTPVNWRGNAIEVDGSVDGTPTENLTLTGNYFDEEIESPIRVANVNGLQIEGNHFDRTSSSHAAWTEWLLDSESTNIDVGENNLNTVIMGLNPPDDSPSVALNANLTATYIEGIQRGSGNIVLMNRTDGTSELFDVNGAQVSVGGTTLTIDPSANLPANKDFSMMVEPGALLDGFGNPYVGPTDVTEWNFRTSGAPGGTDPIVLRLSPADGATGVAVDAELELFFDEVVVPGTGDIAIRNLTDLTETLIPVDDARVSFSGGVVTIDPAVDLPAGKDYAIWVGASAIEDSTGNTFGGIADDTSWNFSTATDGTPPSLFALSPADDAEGIAVDANLIAAFDQPIVLGTGRITIANLTHAQQTVIDVADHGGQLSLAGAALVIDPTGDLILGADYAVRIDATAIRDLAGNAFAGIADDTTWNFRPTPPVAAGAMHWTLFEP